LNCLLVYVNIEHLSLDASEMLELHTSYVLNEQQQPIAVQIPLAEFERLEEILENYGLVKHMEESEDREKLSKAEALEYYQSIKGNHVDG